ncbi:MAG: 2Fe-2S iron-sulfur cluster-binding protein [Candidatus Nanohaloarchaea archaeon]|nr:2Fe-2S iron-sulfur cluster-binding protein [Candidatus Nanohaloarchaea archaeon]
MKKKVPIKVHRYNPEKDEEPYYQTYKVPFTPGMKLLDALHIIQQEKDSTLAVRWNCGEGICGSDAVRLDGQPVLACKTRISEEWAEKEEPAVVEPLKAFPVIKDLVADYSEAYEKEQKLTPYFEGESPEGEFYTMYESDVDRAQEMRKCINCMICYDVCHVIRDGELKFLGPRNIVKASGIDFHPKDDVDRASQLEVEGLNNCNVTRCCSFSCPQDINITENAIIEQKERVIQKNSLIQKLRKKLLKKHGGEEE